MVKIKELDENGDYGGFYVLFVSFILLKVNDNLWNLVKECFGNVLSVFDLC